jgi:surface glycoprotein (TIGR04207 family)
MTGNNTSPGEKLRALFLSALMVLSVMAAGVAFSGAAAATAANTAVSGAGNTATVGDDITVTVDVGSNGETVTFENLVDGEVKETVTVTDGGADDEDGAEDGSIKVTLTAGKSASGSSEIQVTNEDTGDTDSASYTTGNYLVEVTPGEVTHGSTVTIEGDIEEYPGDLQDDETIDYSLVYEDVATDSSENSNDIVLAESDTNDGEFSIRRTFDEIKDTGTLHLNDYPSDAFASADAAYNVFVDSNSDSDTAPSASPPYSQDGSGQSTPSTENNMGNDIVNVRLDVTANPQDPLVYKNSVDVSGDIMNATTGLGQYGIRVKTPSGTTAKTTDTAGDGSYVYTAVFDDAGAWDYGTNEGAFIKYGELNVAAQQANLTLTAAGDNLANFEEDYSLTLKDKSDNAIELDSSDDPASPLVEGYINISGPFADGTGSFAAPTGASIISQVDKDGTDGEIDYIELTTDSNGEASFTAYPTGSSVDATLQNVDDGGATQDDTPDDDTEPEPGVEDTNDAGNTPQSPDYVADSSLSVDNANPVNIVDEAVEDPQVENPKDGSGDVDLGNAGGTAVFSDILTDNGPAIVEVLPLADSTGDRIVPAADGDRLGYDQNRNLEGMTAYRASFELRDGGNNVIDLGGVGSANFSSIDINGGNIDATIFNDSGTLALNSRNGNVLDASFDRGGNNRYEFLLRPTSTDFDDEEITHEIKVNGEDPVFLNLSAAGLDIERFEVDGNNVTEVPASTTLNLTSVVQAPYDNDVPVNNGRVRLTQKGTTTEAETDARTANVNNGRYEFDNFQVADRGIDTGSDNIADDISELVFTAYQYNDSDESNSLDGDEVDRAAVEKLDIAPNRSLQIEFLPEETSVYSGFSGNTFTLTRGIEYDQIGFNLTYQDGSPVNLTKGVNGEKISGGLDALEGNTDFVSLVGPTEDSQGASSEYGVKFDTGASDPDTGTYVISDIESGDNITSQTGTGTLQDSDSFTFPGNNGADPTFDEGQDTYQLNITTPDANFKEHPDSGYLNVKNPSVDGEIVGVASDDINGVSWSDLAHDADDTFANVSDIETATIGVDRVYRVNATFEDTLGTPIDGSKFTNTRVAFSATDDPDSADFAMVDSLGNDQRDPNSDDGIQINNASGEFQYDVEFTSDDNGDGFSQPYFYAWANNQTGVGSSADDSTYQTYVTATPNASNPVVEVYDENGARLPKNPSNSSDNEVLANDETNNLRVEAFPADEDDFVLPDGLEYGFPNNQPFAENIVGTTTSLSQNVVTRNFNEGQLGFLAITPTGTGTGILTLVDANDGSQIGTNPGDSTIVVDTNGNDIEFDVLRSNLRVNLTVASSAQPGDELDVTLRTQSTNAPIESANASLVDPNGNVVTEATTDSNGTTVLSIPSNAASGTYTVETQPAGYQPAEQDVSVAAGAQFEVNNLNPSDATVDRGDTVTVTADIANTGDQQGTTDVFLTLTNSSGSEVLNVSDTVTVQPGSQTTVSFDADTSALEAGNYTHAISAGADSESGNLTVLATQPPTFDVSNLSAPANATSGDTVDVSADVTNTGDSGGTKTVEFRFNGSTLASENVTLLSGQTEQVDFSVDTSGVAPGTYTHGVFTPDDNETATINITGEANITIDSVNSPANITQGDDLTVDVNVSNVGSIAGTESVGLDINGTNVSTGSGAADITFLIDTSGSMDDEIQAIQNGLVDFTDTLESQGVDVRYAVVTFAESSPRYEVRQGYTSNLTETQQTLNAISTSGGTEYSYDAINGSIDDLSERSSANEFFIAFSDEDTESDSNPADPSVLANRLDTEGVSLFAVTLPNGASDGSFGTINPDLSLGSVANASQNGRFYNLDEGNFSAKFENEISGAVASASAGQQVTLNASETKTVTLTINGSATANLAAGDYDLEVTVGDETVTRNLTVESAAPTLPGSQGPSQSTDSDPLLEDVDGDGTANVFDAIALYNNRNHPDVQSNPQFFDFDGDGNINVFDAIELYNKVA